jgi:hypothetical protein
LENDLVKATLQKVERLEAEPVSKPFEIVISLECKKIKVKELKKATVPVCDFDINDKQTRITKTTIIVAHDEWDAAKSSNNPEGKNYCDPKKKIFYELKIADICSMNR